MSELQRLSTPGTCCIVVSWERSCGQVAHWHIVDADGNTADAPICDEHIRGMAGMNSDNEQFLRPALDEIN